MCYYEKMITAVLPAACNVVDDILMSFPFLEPQLLVMSFQVSLPDCGSKPQARSDFGSFHDSCLFVFSTSVSTLVNIQ